MGANPDKRCGDFLQYHGMSIALLKSISGKEPYPGILDEFTNDLSSLSGHDDSDIFRGEYVVDRSFTAVS